MGQLFLFVSAITYSTLPILATVAIYSLRFLHARVAKAYESCRNFVDVTDVLEAIADGFFTLVHWLPRQPNGAMRFVMVTIAIVVHKI